MGHSLCSFILRQIPRRSPTHNAVYFTTTRLGGYTTPYPAINSKGNVVQYSVLKELDLRLEISSRA